MTDRLTNSIENASDGDSRISEFTIADRIAKILDQYDKPMRKKVLNLLNARESTRAVPFGLPIGAVQSPVPKPKGKGKPKAQARAAWKSDPSVTKLIGERKVIVGKLKTIVDENQKGNILKQLRDCEAKIKDAKTKSRNSGSSGNGKENQ